MWIDLVTPKNNPAASRISRRFQRITSFLGELGSGPVTPEQRRSCLRYQPFILELASRESFCRELGLVHINQHMVDVEIGAALRPLLIKYRFPSAGGYSWTDWVDLLSCARLGSDLFIPKCFVHLGQKVEVQLQYPHVLNANGHPQEPMVTSVWVSLHHGSGRAQARELLIQKLELALRRFRRRLKATMRNQGSVSLNVRLIGPGPRPKGGRSQEARFTRDNFTRKWQIMTSFTVELHRGGHTRAVAREIASGCLPTVEGIVGFAPESGRNPGPVEHVQWWAMCAFEGKSPADIADAESRKSLAGVDEGTIVKALYRMGVPSRTK